MKQAAKRPAPEFQISFVKRYVAIAVIPLHAITQQAIRKVDSTAVYCSYISHSKYLYQVPVSESQHKDSDSLPLKEW